MINCYNEYGKPSFDLMVAYEPGTNSTNNKIGLLLCHSHIELKLRLLQLGQSLSIQSSFLCIIGPKKAASTQFKIICFDCVIPRKVKKYAAQCEIFREIFVLSYLLIEKANLVVLLSFWAARAIIWSLKSYYNLEVCGL